MQIRNRLLKLQKLFSLKPNSFIIFLTAVVAEPLKISTSASQAVGQSWILQSLIKGSMMLYFYMSYPWTIRIYHQSIDSFHNYPFREAPILYFYSHNDHICSVSLIENMIKYQREHGYQVFSHDWPVSAHVRHMIQHPIEYKSTLTQFLIKIDPTNALLLKSKL